MSLILTRWNCGLSSLLFLPNATMATLRWLLSSYQYYSDRLWTTLNTSSLFPWKSFHNSSHISRRRDTAGATLEAPRRRTTKRGLSCTARCCGSLCRSAWVSLAVLSARISVIMRRFTMSSEACRCKKRGTYEGICAKFRTRVHYSIRSIHLMYIVPTRERTDADEAEEWCWCKRSCNTWWDVGDGV